MRQYSKRKSKENSVIPVRQYKCSSKEERKMTKHRNARSLPFASAPVVPSGPDSSDDQYGIC